LPTYISESLLERHTSFWKLRSTPRVERRHGRDH
jgi:hypothetical protein